MAMICRLGLSRFAFSVYNVQSVRRTCSGETGDDGGGNRREKTATHGKACVEVLFDMYQDHDELVPISAFLRVLALHKTTRRRLPIPRQASSVTTFVERDNRALHQNGLRHSDPRLAEMQKRIRQLLSKKCKDLIHEPDPVESQECSAYPTCLAPLRLGREDFRSVIEPCLPLILRALQHRLALPEFSEFCELVKAIYIHCKDNTEGKVATYIPQLALMSPALWAASVCSVDGQRFSIGDACEPFTLQSISKPLTYALCLDHLGAETVHRFVGQEPSGRNFNELVLDATMRPHNPMINSGAIVVCSLLKQLIQPQMTLAQKFEFTFNYIQRMAGNERLGFNNAVFVSERKAASRNYALAFLLREHHCYPPKARIRDVMDLYFQCCSMELSCDSLAVVGATLANGGVCPLTEERVLGCEAVRDALSLMHSCGMYDYSGQFAFKVGIPAKSGVSGGLVAVVPNVLALACWSPPLDQLGNTARGLQFCEELVGQCRLHPYEYFRTDVKRARLSRPTTDRQQRKAVQVTAFLLAARDGDLAAVQRHGTERKAALHAQLLMGTDVNMADYEERTALHVAAAAGHLHVVKYLLAKCGLQAAVRDRRGRTPMDDAKEAGHDDVVAELENYSRNRE